MKKLRLEEVIQKGNNSKVSVSVVGLFNTTIIIIVITFVQSEGTYRSESCAGCGVLGGASSFHVVNTAGSVQMRWTC